eukprot:scaffold820_cov376-Prasinococcus_capsulatus_cf.AAC.4
MRPGRNGRCAGRRAPPPPDAGDGDGVVGLARTVGDFRGSLDVYDLERLQQATYHADAHGAIINAIDGFGGPNRGAPLSPPPRPTPPRPASRRSGRCDSAQQPQRQGRPRCSGPRAARAGPLT